MPTPLKVSGGQSGPVFDLAFHPRTAWDAELKLAGEEVFMSNRSDSVVCQRCGRGFIATVNYRDFLARRGVQVVVPVLCTTCFLRTGPQPKQQGEVKWFNPRKRYGFIVTDEGEDVFLHQRQILDGKCDRLHQGQAVLFHLHHSPKGPEALNVELI